MSMGVDHRCGVCDRGVEEDKNKVLGDMMEEEGGSSGGDGGTGCEDSYDGTFASTKLKNFVEWPEENGSWYSDTAALLDELCTFRLFPGEEEHWDGEHGEEKWRLELNAGAEVHLELLKYLWLKWDEESNKDLEIDSWLEDEFKGSLLDEYGEDM